MKKNYYLRGFGIGIFLAVVIMALFAKDNSSMTDEEIKARARELGMVELKTLADLVYDATEVTEEPSSRGEGPIPTSEPIPTNAPLSTESPTSTPISTETVEEVVVVEIIKGDSSNSVCRRLEELGLIENAKSFNQYLCDNGYERKLNIGTYKIAKGVSEKEIAKILTRTR